MTRMIRLLPVLAAASLLAVPPASAYFELELVNGGTMVADSYAEEEDHYRLYRPSGELRIDKARVKTIRERDGRLVEASRPTRAARDTGEDTHQAAAPVPLPEGSDLEALEQQLTRDVILAHRDLLFARNRGEDEKELKKRKKDIEQLERRRDEAKLKLGIR